MTDPFDPLDALDEAHQLLARTRRRLAVGIMVETGAAIMLALAAVAFVFAHHGGIGAFVTALTAAGLATVTLLQGLVLHRRGRAAAASLHLLIEQGGVEHNIRPVEQQELTRPMAELAGVLLALGFGEVLWLSLPHPVAVVVMVVLAVAGALVAVWARRTGKR